MKEERRIGEPEIADVITTLTSRTITLEVEALDSMTARDGVVQFETQCDNHVVKQMRKHAQMPSRTLMPGGFGKSVSASGPETAQEPKGSAQETNGDSAQDPEGCALVLTDSDQKPKGSALEMADSAQEPMASALELAGSAKESEEERWQMMEQLMNGHVDGDPEAVCPDATVKHAKPPSRAAILFSNTSLVGFIILV